jgi:hypothetical protein
MEQSAISTFSEHYKNTKIMPQSRDRKPRKRRSRTPTRSPAGHHLLLVTRTFLQRLKQRLAEPSRHLWKGIVALSVIVGLTAGALFLLPPRITVELFADPADPYYVSFLIKNAWILPLRNVTPFMGLCRLQISNPPTVINGNCADPAAVRLIPPKWKPRDLAVDESFAAPIENTFKIDLYAFAGGDIVLGASYKPWIWPWAIERAFRFVSQKMQDGHYRWVPEARATKS